MTTQLMSLARFQQLIDAFGGNAEHWPVEERDSALALLTQSDTARELQQQAALFDNLLDQAPLTPPSADLSRRIMIALEPPTWWQRLMEWWMGGEHMEAWWRPALTFIIPLVLGIMLGIGGVVSQPQIEQANTYAASSVWEQESSLLALNWEEAD